MTGEAFIQDVTMNWWKYASAIAVGVFSVWQYLNNRKDARAVRLDKREEKLNERDAALRADMEERLAEVDEQCQALRDEIKELRSKYEQVLIENSELRATVKFLRQHYGIDEDEGAA